MQYVVINVDLNQLKDAIGGNKRAIEALINAADRPYFLYVSDFLYISNSDELKKKSTRAVEYVHRKALLRLDKHIRNLVAKCRSHPCLVEGVWPDSKADVADSVCTFCPFKRSKPTGFDLMFTAWARSIADDTAAEALYRALRRDEDWALEVLRRRHLPRQVERVPEADRDDVIQDIVVRLDSLKGFQFPKK